MNAPAVRLISPERAWWLRSILVLQNPRAVFAALRDDSPEDVQARQEPLTAIVVLAGVAGVLSTTFAGSLLDDREFDALLVAVWAFAGGALYGVAAYFIVGGLLFLGGSFAGSIQSYRRARHVLGFAAAPLALSLTVWPVRLATYGSDSFRTGGDDTGAGNAVFEGLELAFLAWAALLLVVAVRTVERWSWPRALAAVALPVAVPALALLRAHGVL